MMLCESKVSFGYIIAYLAKLLHNLYNDSSVMLYFHYCSVFVLCFFFFFSTLYTTDTSDKADKL